MSREGNQAFQQGANTAGRTAGTAVRAGKTTYRTGKKAVRVIRVIPPKVMFIILAVVITIVFLCVLVGGTSETSMDRTYYLTPQNETTANQPATPEEMESMETEEQSVRITATLAGIISKARQDDRKKLEAQIQKQYGGQYSSIKINCETDTAQIYLSDYYDYYGSSSSSASSGSTDSTIRILMVDNDDENDRVVDRFKAIGGCKVKTVFNLNKVDPDKYDALVIPGGGNITPSKYGARKSVHTDRVTDPKKDDIQIAAVKKFYAAKKPILGICRGHQLVNVALGGTLDQGNGEYHEGWHKIKIKKGSLMYDTFGSSLNAYHYHKQQIKKLAPGLKATQWATDWSYPNGDPVVEGYEHESLPIYGIQWHADAVKMGDDGEAAFRAFLDVCREKKGVTSEATGYNAAPSDSKYTSNNPAIQGAINWAINIAEDDSFAYGNRPATARPGCYFCGTNQRNKPKGYEKTYVCMTFVHAAYAHGANDPEMLKDCKGGRYTLSLNDWNFTHWHCWKKVGKSHDLKVSDLEPGDVIIWWADDDASGHASIYIGKGDIVDAAVPNSWGSNSIAVRKGAAASYLRRGEGRSYVMRYVGTGNGSGDSSMNNMMTAGNICKWAEKTAKKEKYVYDRPLINTAHKCPVCNKNSSKGWDDTGFVAACLKHGGKIAVTCSNTGLGTAQIFNTILSRKTNDGALAEWKKKNGADWQIIKKDGKKLKESDLQKGDVLLTYKDGKFYHMAIYIGEGKIADCTKSKGIRYGRKLKKLGGSLLVAFRYVGGSAGAAANMKSYDKITTLKTIDKSDGRTYNLPSSNKYAFDAFAYNSGSYYFLRPHRGANGMNGYVYKYKSDMTLESKSPGEQAYGHGNGCTYCTADGKLYSVTSAGRGDNRVAQVIDPATLTIVGHKALAHGTSGIAFDKITNRFITSSGAGSEKDPGYLYVYDAEMKEPAGKKKIKKMRWATPGDIAAYNGIIYVNISSYNTEKKDGNHIDMYSEDTGAYLGSYDAPYAEIEGIDITDQGELVLSFHADPPFVQFTGINAFGGSGGRRITGGISRSDLEILSAYSISLANSELVFDENAKQTTTEDGGKTGRYFDILEKEKAEAVRKPIDLFWFGEQDRGKIDYEKDLKSKIKDWKLYDWDNYEKSADGNSLTITLKEVPADKILENNFKTPADEVYVNGNGKETNGDAVYTLAENTGKLLFKGMASRSIAPSGASGSPEIALYAGGSLNFPLPPGTWSVTSEFGRRWGRLHAGIDLGSPEGTPIYAAAAGTVIYASNDFQYMKGLGRYVAIDHGNGMKTQYGHQSKVIVNEGDIVQAGQLLGYVGNTGHSFGNHLHFEVIIDGTPTNPRPYLGL